MTATGTTINLMAMLSINAPIGDSSHDNRTQKSSGLNRGAMAATTALCIQTMAGSGVILTSGAIAKERAGRAKDSLCPIDELSQEREDDTG